MISFFVFDYSENSITGYSFFNFVDLVTFDVIAHGDSETFSNEVYKYSFDYPGSWKDYDTFEKIYDQEEAHQASISLDDDIFVKIFTVTVFQNKDEDDESFEDIDAVKDYIFSIQNVLAQQQSEIDSLSEFDLTPDEYTNIEINNDQGIITQVSEVMQVNESFSLLIYTNNLLMLKNDLIYQFSYFTINASEDLDELKDEYESIRDSIEIEEQTIETTPPQKLVELETLGVPLKFQLQVTIGFTEAFSEMYQEMGESNDLILSDTPAINILWFDSNDSEPYSTSLINHTIILSPSSAMSCRISDTLQTYDQMDVEEDGDDVQCTPEFSLYENIACLYSDKKRQGFDTDDPNGEYVLYLSCKDRDDNENIKAIEYSIGLDQPDETPPIISNIQRSSITNHSAIIKWRTDEESNSKVHRGLNKSKLNKTTTSASFVESHSIKITGLKAKTKYFFNITSCDRSNNCRTKGIFNFTTKKTSLDSTDPKIRNITVLVAVNDSSLTWDTDEKTKCDFYYGTKKSRLKKINNISLNFTYNHGINLTNLDNNKTYYYKIRCYDFYENRETTRIYNFSLTQITCIPNFECGSWSSCTEGIKSRTCEDKNNCEQDKTEEELCGDITTDSDEYSDSDDNLDSTDTGYTTDDDLDIDDEDKSSALMIIIMTIITIIILGGLAATYYIYQAGKLPQLEPVFRKFGLSRKPKLSQMRGSIDPIRTYIKQMLEKGYSKDQVYHTLLKHGYRPDQINKYFKF